MSPERFETCSFEPNIHFTAIPKIFPCIEKICAKFSFLAVLIYLTSLVCWLFVSSQDVMRLDNSGRMNSPGRAEGNWRWRVGESDVWDRLRGEADGLRRLMRIYNRLPKGWEQ